MTKERYEMLVKIKERAVSMGLRENGDPLSILMDLESADEKFHLRLDEFLAADDFNFAHDFYGIMDNINRGNGFPSTDFGLFVPRFAKMEVLK